MDSIQTLEQARKLLEKGDISTRDLALKFHKAIEDINPKLGAYITPLDEKAVTTQAEASDRRYKGGEAGLLEGLPIGIKDLFCTKNIRTTAASKILGHFVPPYESTVSTQLKDAGALFLGKTNLDEFAMGSANLTSAFGPALNPYRKKTQPDKALVPGGSSGGSASAVAANLALAATGTDTGGSIRQPSAFCGIVGLKPTYGRCSRYGIIAFASSLDQAGPMTRTVGDNALMLQAMAGFDKKDSTSAPVDVGNYREACSRSVKGMRVGIPKEYHSQHMPKEIEAMWTQGIQWLKDNGCDVVDVSLPHTSYGLPTYYIIASAECSSNLARYDGVRYGVREDGATLDELYEKTRAAGFGTEVKNRILIGTYVLSAGYYDAYYLRAQKVRTLIKKDFEDVYQKVDALLTPVTPGSAFATDQKIDNPVQMYLNDIYTVPASLAGVPALSLPTGYDGEGLPLGLQLIGRPFEEENLFALGSAMEKSASFKPAPTFTAKV